MSNQRTAASGSTPLEWLNSSPSEGSAEIRSRLRNAGLRPTRQRITLLRALLVGAHRHFTAESLYEDAKKAHVNVSLATVYNTLRQFTSAGLIVQIAGDGIRSYFDTNTTTHQHYLYEEQNILSDIPKAEEIPCGHPIPPNGFEVTRIEVIARLRRRSGMARG